jgi:hypothetical protein
MKQAKNATSYRNTCTSTSCASTPPLMEVFFMLADFIYFVYVEERTAILFFYQINGHSFDY